MNRKQRIVEDTEVIPVALWWLDRFLRDDIARLSAEELADWAEWASHEPHLECFRRLKRVWHQTHTALGSVSKPSAADVATDEYDGSVPISDWVAQTSSRRRRRQLSRWPKFLSIAACITLVTAALMKYGSKLWSPDPSDQVQAYSTGPSEHRFVTLPDGSKIILGARTELSTHYTATRRLIFLDRGEASFDVAHNARRPFTVLAGGGAITALGTQFDVRRELDSSDVGRVTVTVSTGTVEIGPPQETISEVAVDTSGPRQRSQSKWTPARLVKGQQITYDSAGTRVMITTADLEAASAWKEGRLEYRHTPLKVVIPSVNRYSEKPIELADPEVGELPYSGTVFEGQVPEWLRALETAYPIEVIDTPERIVIQSKPRQESEHG
jgi:transmembrane sensor